MFGKWDPELTTALLEQMTPGTARVDVQSTHWDQISATVGKVTCPLVHGSPVLLPLSLLSHHTSPYWCSSVQHMQAKCRACERITLLL